MQQINEQQFLPRFTRMNRASGKAPLHVLAGDLGGTKTRLALFEAKDGSMEVIHEHIYRSRDYASFTEIIKDFIAQQPERPPQRICIGVAGPVIKGRVELTNLSKELTVTDIQTATGVEETMLINDLEATAYGLATIGEDSLLTLHRGEPETGGNMAIIAPGTGLGEAGMYWDGALYAPFATEGGHCDFAPRNELDMDLLQYLQEKYQIVSWERLVSGPGIYDTFRFLRDVRHMHVPDWLDQELLEKDPAAVISTNAIQQKVSICIKTMELFVRYLAREAANLVFKMKATGGLFLGGGIPPRIVPLLEDNNFYHHYLQGDRLIALLATVPIHVIINDKAALRGAAYYAVNRENS
ncbi:glucokinase [Chitinophaga japonensis]|uniref:Glucokinase n=1 Tax=Chitinophaga japonensis TaxID=104662 RepID=A0A562SZ14_CHIJA|nr:glucokinase [Chitinophaga japonensis]TWI86531.1 glucokinase [Chitinophaga japonensis]